MNYFLLAETEFFRLINEAGDCNMETAYTAFATQVIELCNGNLDANRTIIALAYIEMCKVTKVFCNFAFQYGKEEFYICFSLVIGLHYGSKLYTKESKSKAGCAHRQGYNGHYHSVQ